MHPPAGLHPFQTYRREMRHMLPPSIKEKDCSGLLLENLAVRQAHRSDLAVAVGQLHQSKAGDGLCCPSVIGIHEVRGGGDDLNSLFVPGSVLLFYV